MKLIYKKILFATSIASLSVITPLSLSLYHDNSSWDTHVVGFPWMNSSIFFSDDPGDYASMYLSNEYAFPFRNINKTNMSVLAKQQGEQFLSDLDTFGDTLWMLGNKRNVCYPHDDYVDCYKQVFKDNLTILNLIFNDFNNPMKTFLYNVFYKYSTMPSSDIRTKVKFEQTEQKFTNFEVSAMNGYVASHIKSLNEQQYYQLTNLDYSTKNDLVNYLGNDCFFNGYDLYQQWLRDEYANNWEFDIYGKVMSKIPPYHEFTYTNELWNRLETGDIILFGEDFNGSLSSVYHVAMYAGIRNDTPYWPGQPIHTILESEDGGVEYGAIDDSTITIGREGYEKMFIFRINGLTIEQRNKLVNWGEKQTSTNNHRGAEYLMPSFGVNGEDGDFSFTCGSFVSAVYQSINMNIQCYDYFMDKRIDHLKCVFQPDRSNIYEYCLHNPDKTTIIYNTNSE